VEPARLNRCAQCQELYLYCKEDGVRRRYKYCSDECAAAGKAETDRKARHDYRSKGYGKAQHADEEQRRRDRLRNSVGDQNGQPREGTSKLVAMKAPECPRFVQEQDPVEWCVEVPPELSAVARRLCRARKEMTCVVCGRRGYVAAVVVVRPKASKRRQGGPPGPLRRRE
jgi:hypothetical protein